MSIKNKNFTIKRIGFISSKIIFLLNPISRLFNINLLNSNADVSNSINNFIPIKQPSHLEYIYLN